MSDPSSARGSTLPFRRLAAWERNPGCVVCEIPLAVDDLDAARVIPFAAGDRVAHRTCEEARRVHGSELPPLRSDFGMGH